MSGGVPTSSVATVPTAASQAACTRCIGVVDSSCSSCDGCTQFVLCQARQHPPAPLRAAPGLCRAQPRPASSRGTKCEPRSDTPLRACRGWSNRRRSFCNLVHPSMQPATAMLAQASLRQAWAAKQVRTLAHPCVWPIYPSGRPMGLPHIYIISIRPMGLPHIYIYIHIYHPSGRLGLPHAARAADHGLKA
jgi:hypothetical protein